MRDGRVGARWQGRFWCFSALGSALLLAAAPPAWAKEPMRVVVHAGGGSDWDQANGALDLARGLPLDEGDDSGAFSVFVEGPAGWLPTSVGVWTTDAAGDPLDQLGPVPLELTACPDGLGPEAACGVARALRLVPSALERELPGWSGAALIGRVGGEIIVDAGGNSVTVPVLGPRSLGGGAYRARVRVRIVRMAGGQAALDPNDARATQLGSAVLAEASALWEQCGSQLTTSVPSDVSVVDPPQSEHLEVGCGGGLPASGGELQLVTGRGTVRLSTRAGERPGSVAARLALELEKRGLSAWVAENPASESSAGPSYDVVLADARAGGRLAPVPGKPMSTDPTLGVCRAEVTLENGLTHFEDETAKAGTLEERALVRGLTDGDPTTIDVLVVPYFSGHGRIGESFIGGGAASVEGVVIVDRAGVRATARSSTLAHEMGHVLLAEPGHPDDFGLDGPGRLMDSDASDATAFGPRRLTLAECQRALAEHGPRAALPLLEELHKAAPPGAARLPGAKVPASSDRR